MGDGALTKADMAERLFEELGLNKREAKEIVEQFFEEIHISRGRFGLSQPLMPPNLNPIFTLAHACDAPGL